MNKCEFEIINHYTTDQIDLLTHLQKIDPNDVEQAIKDVRAIYTVKNMKCELDKNNLILKVDHVFAKTSYMEQFCFCELKVESYSYKLQSSGYVTERLAFLMSNIAEFSKNQWEYIHNNLSSDEKDNIFLFEKKVNHNSLCKKLSKENFFLIKTIKQIDQLI